MSEEAKHTPNYADMPSHEMVQAVGDNAAKWATAFCQTAKKIGQGDIDEGWMIGWFANAIECSHGLRIGRSDAELATLRTKLESAEKALEPFARAAQEEDGSERLEWRWHDDNELVESTAALVELTAGDFRKARAALSSIRGEQP